MHKKKLVILICLISIFIAGYSNAEVEVKKKYYPNGQLKSETPYKDGQIEGIMKVYYESGKLFQEVPYKNGKSEGVMKTYNESGELSSEMPYENNELNGIVKEYYENGTLKLETPYKNDEVQGIARCYTEDGTLEAEMPHRDGELNGMAKMYYEDGTLERETPYKDGKREGVERAYDKNGKLEAEMPYKEDKLNGVGKYYDNDGNLVNTVIFQNHEIINEGIMDRRVEKIEEGAKDIKIEVAKADVIANYPVAFDLYKLDNGMYPTTEQGFAALLEKLTVEPVPPNWNGPYLKTIPKDPWGNPYNYVCPGVHNQDGYDLSSYGPDGVESEDDITNWGLQ